MSAYDCDDDLSVGDLAIDDVPMFCAAWRVENLYEWWLPATQRGVTRVLPGVDGVKGYRRRRTLTRRPLNMMISGEADIDGVPASNFYECMYANIAYLTENVVNPADNDAGTRTAVLTLPDGSTMSGPVQVLGMEVSEMRANARYCYAVIDVQLLNGYLTPDSS